MYYILEEIDRFTQETGSVIFRYMSDGAILSFPAHPENSDYRAYLEWLAEGNTPEPWNPEEIE